MLHRPQLNLAARSFLNALERLHGVELGGIVEIAVKHEHAPGIHVGDGVEHLHVQTISKAADELAVGDRVAGVTSGVHLLDGKGQLQAPFEHHLEDDVLIAAVGLHHIEQKLAGLGALDTALVELEHAKADVGDGLGFLAKTELFVGFHNVSCNLCSCPTNSFLANLAKVLISIARRFTIRFAHLWQLHAYERTSTSIKSILPHNSLCAGSRAREEA